MDIHDFKDRLLAKLTAMNTTRLYSEANKVGIDSHHYAVSTRGHKFLKPYGRQELITRIYSERVKRFLSK